MELYKNLAIHLMENGIDVYSISQHQGECKEPFIVVEDKGILNDRGYTFKINNIDLVLYFPKGSYTKLENFINSVIDIMKKYNRAIYSKEISDVMIDTDKNAYVVILPYKVIKTF